MPNHDQIDIKPRAPIFDQARIDAREASITGMPPRIPPMTEDEFSDEVRAITRQLRVAAGLPPEGAVPEFIATALRHPKMYLVQCDYAIELMSKGTLSARDRELAVLRVGWRCEAPFEWAEHVSIGKRSAGITDEEILWMIEGPDAPGWSRHDAAIIRAVDELHDDSMITDATWAVLAETLDDKQLIELPMLIGQYHGVAFLQNSLRSALMPGAIGLAAR